MSPAQVEKVGVEVGGTFTDLVAFTTNGIVVRKVPSVPSSPDEGVIAALEAGGMDLGACRELAHGSTIATNAVLERKGAPIAFVTTKGFKDLLHLQRHDRSDIYDIKYRKPVPIVDRSDCLEVDERILSNGVIARALNETSVRDVLIPALVLGGYKAVALCLLNAYVNSIHELRLAELIRDAIPSITITCSVDVSLEFREYERASTTALSAYVQPVIDRYVKRLDTHLKTKNFGGGLSIMQSNGGRLPAEGIRKNAIAALFSGPAAGVIGALRQVQKSGFQNIITLDVGGTSSDVCVVDSGTPLLTRDFKIDGLPVCTPMINIVTTGAGGGSIVKRDDGGMLRVGPQSAGANPGPACYGKGGLQPTVTDAHVVRGTIRSDAVLGGSLKLNAERAMDVMRPLAEAFGVGIEQMADNAIRLANFNIVRAIELTTTELGKDPRDYSLVAFGGGGPLHAARVADALGMKTVVVPSNAGVISAFGLVVSDFALHDNATRHVPLSENAPATLAKFIEEARSRLKKSFQEMDVTGPFSETIAFDMRFSGQAFNISVQVESPDFTVPHLEALFLKAYEEVYFYAPKGSASIEVIGVNLTMSVKTLDIPDLSEESLDDKSPRASNLFEEKAWRRATVLSTGYLKTDEKREGPLLIEDKTSTIFVPESWSIAKDRHHNLILRREAV